MDPAGRDIFVIDARGDGKRFIVRADEKLTAFLELSDPFFREHTPQKSTLIHPTGFHR